MGDGPLRSFDDCPEADVGREIHEFGLKAMFICIHRYSYGIHVWICMVYLAK